MLSQKKAFLEHIQYFGVDEIINELCQVFECCGIDYANVNEAFTWCAPLTKHKYAARFHNNSNYRIQDPYLNYDLIPYLPKFCQLAEIAVHATSWQELFNPKHSDYGTCYAISYWISDNLNFHRFVIYFDNPHKMIQLFTQFTNLEIRLRSLLKDTLKLIGQFYEPFSLLPECFKSIVLPSNWFHKEAKKRIQITHNLNDKEVGFIELLGQGISDKKTLSNKLNMSPRSIDNYLFRLKKTFHFHDNYDLYDYAKKYSILSH
ncbi:MULTISPECIES: hypothetical protein [Cysteiniphilum]|uniref:hypothetical protein n=1 Tax=Cysteiniphilum TaxID=2056696 RepID=UPI001783752B|nr:MULTISPECIES: hypothetical protein [Cysteiniphilum]